MTCSSPAMDAVRAIHDLLYLDMDDGRSVYDPDKEWNVDMLETIAEIIDACIPRPASTTALLEFHVTKVFPSACV